MYNHKGKGKKQIHIETHRHACISFPTLQMRVAMEEKWCVCVVNYGLVRRFIVKGL